jgi:hypothetical protein
MIRIIDNIIPASLQNEIKAILFDGNFPWYHNSDITSSKTPEDERTPGLSHFFVKEYQAISPYYGILSSIPHIAGDKVSFAYSNLFQCRAFLQYPLNRSILKSTVDNLHIDHIMDHLVVLYYVCDSDGSTIIVDKKKQNNIYEHNLKYTDYTVLEAIKPKQGRAVIFDGSYYHTAEQPQYSVRSVVNFNLV